VEIFKYWRNKILKKMTVEEMLDMKISDIAKMKFNGKKHEEEIKPILHQAEKILELDDPKMHSIRHAYKDYKLYYQTMHTVSYYYYEKDINTSKTFIYGIVTVYSGETNNFVIINIDPHNSDCSDIDSFVTGFETALTMVGV
jgi:hypothetical protein